MKKGFTIVEILFGIAILGIAITIISLSFSNLNKNAALDTSADTAISIFNEARFQTLSAKSGAQYGVNIQESQLILFKGGAYSPSDSNNIVTPLHALVAARNITLSDGGSSVVFTRLTGAANQNGTFELYLKDEPARYRTIFITATGIAQEK